MDPMEDPDDILRANRSREKTYMFDVAFDYSASQVSRVKAQIKRNETNAAFVFLEYAPKPFIFFFLCRRRCTELQPKG